MDNEKKQAVLRLAKAVDGLTNEQLAAATQLFALLVAPETHSGVVTFADRLVSGEIPATTESIQSFCAGLTQKACCL